MDLGKPIREHEVQPSVEPVPTEQPHEHEPEREPVEAEPVPA